MAKKLLKKIGKAAALAAGLAGAAGLMKKRARTKMAGMDDAGLGVRHFSHPLDQIPFADHSVPRYSDHGELFSKGGRVTGAAKRGFGRALMKGKK